jgi:4'-phosphopantetheinyl transferase
VTTLRLPSGAIDLWYGEPRGLSSETLSVDEVLRASTILHEEARKEFVLARSWLRAILARYTGVPAAHLQFGRGHRGKPRLLEWDIEFSISHARGPVLVAVTRAGRVGVDVEVMRQGVWEPKAAALVMSRTELESIGSSADSDRTFLQAWTRKEAYAKAIGDGLTEGLTCLDLWPDPIALPHLEITSLTPDARTVGALAGPPGTQIRWRAK